jgi:hypothetical protein
MAAVENQINEMIFPTSPNPKKDESISVFFIIILLKPSTLRPISFESYQREPASLYIHRYILDFVLKGLATVAPHHQNF